MYFKTGLENPLPLPPFDLASLLTEKNAVSVWNAIKVQFVRPP